ncbi:glycosyltransferase family 2 protein [uncultured Christiangramia sp.]|uniref:glycosyltransferase family 2 protein n=1 Tax=uncultured Christiangramia sp. TaxID=503836 RepID=UPI00262508AE|nr:glycosyltransferase family 2 protein [uncultured Christiangramia sp.]
MVSQPLVSIITPVYNREKYLTEMVESVLDQTYTNWELILVDDGSKDSSWKIMQTYSKADHRIRILKRPKNRLKGANAARNYGFENSKGSFINWFDSDDKMHPEFIERKVNRFISNAEVNIVFSKTIQTDFQERKVYDERLSPSQNLFKDYILRKVSWYLPDGMFRRTYLEGRLLFDENLLAGQDRDFYIRLLCSGTPKVKILDFHGTFYRIHPGSISEEIYRNGNYKMRYSHYLSLINQVQILKRNNKLDEILREFYFKDISKRLPAVVKTKNSIRHYFSQLISLSVFSLDSLKIWAKVALAYLSLIFFDKGERFLK